MNLNNPEYKQKSNLKFKLNLSKKKTETKPFSKSKDYKTWRNSIKFNPKFVI